MSYLIKWESQGLEGIPGKASISLADRVYNDTSTSLVLTGKGLKDYGLFQQENFLHLLENFASCTAPLHPTIGQFWYNPCDHIMYIYDLGLGSLGPSYDGWSQAIPQIQSVAGYNEFNSNAEDINLIIGAPTFVPGGTSMQVAATAFGWGQTDLVPTYTNASTLSPASIAAEPFLPSGSVFPPQADNNAWVVLLSRLRKAYRQVDSLSVGGANETNISQIGFANDARPAPPGNTYANILNNNSSGPVPYQGSITDYRSGWDGYGFSTVSSLYDGVQALISTLKAQTGRFSLGAGSLSSAQLVTATRTNPSQSLFVAALPGGSEYVHTIACTFPSQAAAQAYFNAGGNFQFNWSFTPQSSPHVETNIETDWKNFLNTFTGLTFDYQGTRVGSTYLGPISSNPSTSTLGFYGILTGVGNKIFERDVLSTLSNNLYSSHPPTDGGINIVCNGANAGGQYVLTFDIHFYLNYVTLGSGSPPNDTTSSALFGAMVSQCWTIHANTLNTNSPAISVPSAIQSGTFITAV